MIVIRKVRCKNFLSYGNSYTELSLDTHKATLVRGKNGHGKSAWMDIILYALYGKPYRNISKPQLINSINNSSMVVEIDFSISGIEYKIVRGQKPSVFDIFRNGELIEQNAAMRDYQDFLEKQILKVNEKTFKQIAVLGSASYVPFMQLSAAQRRELVESILDIEVFSKMSVILKERINSTKTEFVSIGHKLELKKSEAIAQKRVIQLMQENTKSRVDEYENEKTELIREREQLETNVLEKLESELTDLLSVNLPDVSEEYFKVTENISELTREVNRLKKVSSSVSALTKCTMCLQDVPHEHIEHVVSTSKQEIDSIAANVSKLEKQKLDLEKKTKAQSDHNTKIVVVRSSIMDTRNKIKTLNGSIKALDEKIKDLLSETGNVEAEQEKLKSIMEEGARLVDRKNTLSEEKHIQDIALQLLKDTGIKTAIVKEYLPILNQLINKYLAMFDFFVDFTLDESFSEVIRSRGRDVFSYSSFSEGEKRRIDFAILMAFRQLAALKNSAKTNILIFDEIVDGAFDLEARNQFNDLIGSIPNSNVIVISHADANTESYDRVIQVEKKGDFSVYTVME